jgi:hypothetical protein
VYAKVEPPWPAQSLGRHDGAGRAPGVSRRSPVPLDRRGEPGRAAAAARGARCCRRAFLGRFRPRGGARVLRFPAGPVRRRGRRDRGHCRRALAALAGDGAPADAGAERLCGGARLRRPAHAGADRSVHGKRGGNGVAAGPPSGPQPSGGGQGGRAGRPVLPLSSRKLAAGPPDPGAPTGRRRWS